MGKSGKSKINEISPTTQRKKIQKSAQVHSSNETKTICRSEWNRNGRIRKKNRMKKKADENVEKNSEVNN